VQAGMLALPAWKIMFKSKLKIFAIIILAIFCAFLISLNSLNFSQPKAAEENTVGEKDALIETALYTRAEFFGANAIVPFPTATARENLAKVLGKYPNEAEIYLKLAQLDEKLEKFEDAENELKKRVEIKSDKLSALYDLAWFYNRRAEFEKQAEIFNQMIELAPKEKRAEYFSNLINLAKTHKLEKYLKADFYKEFITQDASAFSILEQYLDKLIEEKNYEEALKFVRESREKFPESKEYFIKKEVSILLTQNKKKDAENVYYQNFSPDWSDNLTGEFYSFLNEIDRYKAFGKELKTKFKQNPTNFDAAIRLIHYLKYDGDSSESVILALENARAKSKIEWKADELLTVSLFLISEGNADLSSRFLYTLFLKQEANKGGELRAKILYQLFALLCDAENDRIALTKGDLNFYKDIAASDTNPGITSGILSLIFADENPRKELENKQKSAVKLFNRAAAYRIFSEYKAEFPNSPQLARMYLDIIYLYTAEKDFEIAQNTLNEFEERFKDSAEFPSIAMKLADAYVVFWNSEKEREIYQKVLDYLGSKRNEKNPFISFETSENSFANLNMGIKIPTEKAESEDSYYYSPPKTYTNFISKTEPKITYEFVLNRYVSSLAKEKKTQEILALYNNEIAKYSDEEQLYEDFLVWLGQTNFTDEQLKIYKNALAKFQNKTWRDKLARWYIKNQRKEEFAELSRDLLGKFNDQETQEYLWNFIDSTTLANPESFEGKLYYALYQKAHERFPHNQTFVGGLLKYYQATKQTDEWRKLLAEYYFEMPEIRSEFLTNLSKKGELRNYLAQSIEKTANNDSIKTLPYKLFRADASAKLSNFEVSVVAYRELNRLFPNTSEFSERLINFTRSFGQTDTKFLTESAEITHEQADFLPVSAEYRTRAGEIQAELGDYKAAKNEWQKLISTAKGEPETYLNTATVLWDYFQYDDALEMIKHLRSEMKNDALYAFQAGAIYEAKHEKGKAIAEYVKQLGANSEDEDVLLDISRTKKRLVQLNKRENFNQIIKSAFQNERKNEKNASALVLNYTHFLIKSEQNAEAINLLNKEVTQSNSEDFLLEAKQHFENLSDNSGERLTLKQLAKTAENKKNAISYELRLADDYSDSGEKQETAKILADLIQKYPTNYGVLSEADEFYWRIGFQGKSLEVLQKGVNLGRGNYKYIFRRKLASRLIALDRIKESQQILVALHNENKEDTEVFDELANIYVRENKPEFLRKIAAETLETIKKQDIDPRFVNYEMADFRKRLVNSFTRLKDYDSAVAQYIEIINRQPDDEENVEEAIKYVKRYGGAETFLDYYQKLAANAYKNYRWTLVLARIYEANKDYEKSIENYKLAIHNQPEMVELYSSLADVYEKAKNWDAAIETIDKVLELTHETPNYLKRKIEILENAGRIEEAAIVREKLTGIKKTDEKSLQEEFAEAGRLSATEKAKAIELYRTAFNKLVENPLESQMKSSDIVGYAKTVRQEDNLDEIAERFWKLRDKLIAEMENQNAVTIGKTRSLLDTLDGAFPEVIGKIATENATGNELDALYKLIETKIESSKYANDKYRTFSLLQNLIERCGFISLKEKILIARKDEAFNLGNYENYHSQLRSLLNYYDENGEFHRELELLETESSRDTNQNNFDYQLRIADVSKVLGNLEKEVQSLKNYFDSPKKQIAATDEYVNRYFQMLYESNRAELENLAKSNSQHHLQIINFFIAKCEKNLSHIAIENASFSQSWKSSKNAETSLALAEFEDEKASYFFSALQFAPIGELIKRTNENEIKGDDWFRLTYKFGNWLKLGPNENHKNLSEKYLPAMTENRPKDVNEQFVLGKFYLQQKDFARALEHFEIARNMNFSDKNLWANLGIAYFQRGETEKANEFWNKIIEDENRNLEDLDLYFTTLSEYGPAGRAREKLLPILRKIIKETPDENPAAELLIFLRKISDSIINENERAEFWLNLTNSTPKHLFIPKFIIEKSLVEQAKIGEFYQILIERSEGTDSWTDDSEYKQLLEMNWSFEEAEAILDQEKNFEIEEPESEKLDWQKEYLEFLIEKGDFAKAKSLISQIEMSLRKKYARPVWLRLAEFQFDLENGISKDNFRKIKIFVGIEDVPDAKQLNPPNLVRLNEIVKLLKTKRYDAESLNLREAFYSRSIALKKYNLANFNGLAEVEFEKNENETALKLLQLMTEISFEETRETALSGLHSINLIKQFSPKNPELYEISEENNLSKNSALKLAAETSARFGRIDAAINFRQKLLLIALEDGTNKIELARLFARKQNFQEAAKLLGSIISDRNALRNERWQAVFAANEISEKDSQFWHILKNNLTDLQTKDSEMSNAIEAIALWKNGNSDRAIQTLETGEFQTPQILFLKAIIAETSNQNEIALKAFLDAQKSSVEFGATSGFAQENPLFQIIRLYSGEGKPLAALKIAERFDENLKAAGQEFQISDFKFQTLDERARENYQKSRLEIFELLSKAAENIGELSKATEFEKSRFDLLSDEESLQSSRSRIEELERKIYEQNKQPKIDFRVDESLVSK
jgi:tetratricopeptide (TPR) repeat protein